MKTYAPEAIRNVGVFGHSGSGKTMLTEALLFCAKATDRLGRIEDGSTVSDYDPDEINATHSIHTSLAPLEWQGVKVNLLDTPGFVDFAAETQSALRACDTALLVASAVTPLEVGLEQQWAAARDAGKPVMLVLSKMDKEHADFDRAMEALRDGLSASIAAFTIPMGAADAFAGVIDLIDEAAYTYGTGRPVKGPVPADQADRVKKYHEALMEVAAEGDDDLLAKYLDAGALSPEEIRRGLTLGVASGKCVPLLVLSSTKNIGVSVLLEELIALAPSAAAVGPVTGIDPRTGAEATRSPDPHGPLAALIFKTTTDPYVGKLSFVRVYSGTIGTEGHAYNASREKDEKFSTLLALRGKRQEPAQAVPAGDIAVVAKLAEGTTGDTLSAKEAPIILPPLEFPEPQISMAIFPKTKADEDKMGAALHKIAQEDPTLVVRLDKETHETIISGLGERHLELARDRLKRKFNVDVSLAIPKIPYKETIKGKVQVQGRHKKQSGGRGQFGDVWLALEPLPRGKEFEFVDKVVGGVIPRNFIPSVEKGVRRAMEEGAIAGYPIVDLRVALYDGSYHTVDSSDIAFQIAGSMALKKGMEQAHPVLLEPVILAEVTVPEQYMGDVMGDLNSRRGHILGMEPNGKGHQVIRAQVPLAEMQRYAIDLRSSTQGRGRFHLQFDHYAEVPPHAAEPIIAAFAATKHHEE